MERLQGGADAASVARGHGVTAPKLKENDISKSVTVFSVCATPMNFYVTCASDFSIFSFLALGKELS